MIRSRLWLAAGLICVAAQTQTMAQDLLSDTVPLLDVTLNLKRYVDLSGQGSLISMTTQPTNTGNTNLFVTTQTGNVFSVADNGTGTGSASLWFDYDAAIGHAITNAQDGFELDGHSSVHGGLRSIAFHPEFATNGKFYTSAMVDRPNGDRGQTYLGTRQSGFDAESVVAEWTVNPLDPDHPTYRELFRVQMPVFDHPVKQIAFNHYATPGDEDYGLLYIAHGDGSVASATAGGGQNRDDALGKILRINPLQNGADAYTTPGNPFLGDATTLDEIYTLGHRNPHNLSFAEHNGESFAIVAEAGRDNIEEVNVLTPGGDYGWSDREGTFIHNNHGGTHGNGYGLDYGVSGLPANEWELNDYIYPAAQYDHDTQLGNTFASSAIAGGFVIDNNGDPDLQGKYLFADFGGKSGWVYQADLDDLIGSHTQLADHETPDALTQAPLSRLKLTLDSDGDGTIDNTADNLNSLIGQSRNDVRFGRGPNGEMFITSKRTGQVYLVTNTLQPIPGDLDTDGFVAIDDLNIILAHWNQNVAPGVWFAGDPSGDGFIGIDDLNLVLGNWNTGTPPSETVNIPEPSASVFFVIAGVAWRTRRPA